MAHATANRPRTQRRPLEPVQVEVELVAYAATTGLGLVHLTNEDRGTVAYAIRCQHAGDHLVRVAFSRPDEKTGEVVTHHVDHDAETKRHTCTCPDHCYRGRDCRHILAVRQLAPRLAPQPTLPTDDEVDEMCAESAARERSAPLRAVLPQLARVRELVCMGSDHAALAELDCLIGEVEAGVAGDPDECDDEDGLPWDLDAPIPFAMV